MDRSPGYPWTRTKSTGTWILLPIQRRYIFRFSTIFCIYLFFPSSTLSRAGILTACALDLLQGVGISFGPDVTKKWCTENKVSAIIRSHEVRQGGIRRCYSRLNCTDASALAIFSVHLSYLLYRVVVRCPGYVAT